MAFSTILPAKDGNCLWVLLSYGITVLPLASPIDDPGWQIVQHDWLVMLRSAPRQEFCPAFTWEQCLEIADVSKRTWQGWEQGRKIPYFKAAALAYQLWQMDAAAPRHNTPHRLSRKIKPDRSAIYEDLKHGISEISDNFKTRRQAP